MIAFFSLPKARLIKAQARLVFTADADRHQLTSTQNEVAYRREDRIILDKRGVI